MSQKRNKILSASEIGQYVYCSQSWYLQRCGYEPDSPALQPGKTHHRALGNTLDIVQKDTRKASRLAILGCVMLLIATFLIIYEVIL